MQDQASKTPDSKPSTDVKLPVSDKPIPIHAELPKTPESVTDDSADIQKERKQA